MRPVIAFATLVDHLCHSPIHEARAQVSAWERGREAVDPYVFLQAIVRVPARRLSHLGPIWSRLKPEEKIFLAPGLSRLGDDRKAAWETWPTSSETLLDMARDACTDTSGITLAWIWRHPRAPHGAIQKALMTRATSWGCAPVFFAMAPERASADLLGQALESAVYRRPFERDVTQVETILDALIAWTPVAQRKAAQIAILLGEGSDEAIARLPALRAGSTPIEDQALVEALGKDYLTDSLGDAYANSNAQLITDNAVSLLWVTLIEQGLNAHFPATLMADIQAIAAPEAGDMIENLQDPTQRAAQVVTDLSEERWGRAACLDRPGLPLAVKLSPEPWYAPGASPRWKALDQVWQRPELSDDLKERLWAGVAPEERVHLPTTHAFRQARERNQALAQRPAASSAPVRRRRS